MIYKSLGYPLHNQVSTASGTLMENTPLTAELEQCSLLAQELARRASDYSRSDKNRLKGKFDKKESRKESKRRNKNEKKILVTLCFGGRMRA